MINQLKVMIFEDDPLLAEVYQLILGSIYELTMVSDETLKTGIIPDLSNFDLVISDYDMGGECTFEKVRAECERTNRRLLLVSGNMEVTYKNQFPKPLHIPELKTAIQKALEN